MAVVSLGFGGCVGELVGGRGFGCSEKGDLVLAGDLCVLEGWSCRGVGGGHVGGWDVPDVAEEFFDGHGGGQSDPGQVRWFCLDQNAAVASAVQPLGFEKTTAKRSRSLVVFGESRAGPGRHFENRRLLGGADEDEEVAVPSPGDARLAWVAVRGFARDCAIADVVGVTPYQLFG